MQVALGLSEQFLLMGGFVTRKRPELGLLILGSLYVTNCYSVATYSSYHFCLFV